jgi:hypothetical protein
VGINTTGQHQLAVCIELCRAMHLAADLSNTTSGDAQVDDALA